MLARSRVTTQLLLIVALLAFVAYQYVSLRHLAVYDWLILAGAVVLIISTLNSLRKASPVPDHQNVESTSGVPAASPGTSAPTSLNSPKMGTILRSFLPDIIINGVLPYVLYQYLKQHHFSDLTALAMTATVPALYSIVGIIRRHRIDLIAAVVLLGLAINAVVLLIGGDAKLLLLRESIFTGMSGIAFLVPLLLPRPFMFYIGRYVASGNDPAKTAAFNERWRDPYFRFILRLYTAVWGAVYTVELIVRVIMIYTLPIATFLAVSPFVFYGITLATIAWSLTYSRGARHRRAQWERRRMLKGAI